MSDARLRRDRAASGDPRINPHTGEEWPHPSRVTASGQDHVTGLLPRCPECPLAEGHDGDHLRDK